jgi:hypothetical protein
MLRKDASQSEDGRLAEVSAVFADCRFLFANEL